MATCIRADCGMPRADAKHQSVQSGEPPRISVIMAAYNAERFIGEAIESVLAQTYSNWELVCIEDCSTDGTAAIVAHYSARDPRVRLIRNTANLGGAHSRNVGVEQARGEYLAMFDADDLSLPDRFERSIRAFEEGGECVGLVGSQAYFIDEDGVPLGQSTMVCIPEYLTGEVVPDACPLRHSSWMMRACVFRAVGGYEPLFRSWVDDYDLYLRAVRVTRAVYLSPPLVKWRWHTGQMTSQTSRVQEAMRLLARARRIALDGGRPFAFHNEYERAMAHLPAETPHREVSRIHYQMGRRYLTIAATAKARREFGLALRADRAHWKPWLALLLTYLPASLRSRVLR